MRRAGAPESVIQAQRDRDQAQVYELWPENEKIFTVFRRLATQWTMVSVGLAGVMHVGLRYREIVPMMRRCRIPKRRWDRAFSLIQDMEAEALPILNKRQ
jgi:hypothetical protein